MEEFPALFLCGGQLFLEGFHEDIKVRLRDLPADQKAEIWGQLGQEYRGEYVVDSTPKAFRLRVCDSDDTASTFRGVSICFEMKSCLLPNLLRMTSMASR